jgi:hypothetical protein
LRRRRARGLALRLLRARPTVRPAPRAQEKGQSQDECSAKFESQRFSGAVGVRGGCRFATRHRTSSSDSRSGTPVVRGSKTASWRSGETVFLFCAARMGRNFISAIIAGLDAGVAELADAPDSKSGGRKAVWVRFPPPAPLNFPPSPPLREISRRIEALHPQKPPNADMCAVPL